MLSKARFVPLIFLLFSFSLLAADKVVSVIVPVYRELHNGNLIRLIDQFGHQSDSNFEIVLVVNNTPELASQGQANPIFKENQDTLKVLHYARSGETKLLAGLSQDLIREAQTARAAVHGKFTLKIVDLSTKGHPKVIGTIRQRGVDEAARGSSVPPANHVIAFMDADTQVADSYVSRLRQHYTKPNTETLFLSLGFQVEKGSPQDVYQTTYKQQYQFAWKGALGALTNEPTLSGGPLITTTLDSLRRVGGVPDVDMGEDYALSRLLISKTKYRFAHDMQVTTNDRVRPDGYDAAQRLARLESAKTEGWKKAVSYHGNPVVIVLMSEIVADLHKGDGAPTTVQIRNVFESFGLSFDPAKWKEEVDKARNEKWGPYSEAEAVKKYCEKYAPEVWIARPDKGLLAWIRRTFPSSEFSDLETRLEQLRNQHTRELALLTKNATEVIHQIKSGKPAALDGMGFFFANNTWIEEYISKKLKAGMSESAVLDDLKQDFPDYFAAYDQTPYKEVTQTLNEIRHQLLLARNEPEKFPTFHRLFGAFPSHVPFSCERASRDLDRHLRH